jgi:hypothetical protein
MAPHSIHSSSAVEDRPDDPEKPLNQYVVVAFKAVDKNPHPTIQTVLMEWLISPQDLKLYYFKKATYVYFHNI